MALLVEGKWLGSRGSCLAACLQFFYRVMT